jgi:uncharacterized protein YwgA
MTSRAAQLIRYFVERAPGCGRTRLVKFLYMADHEARRFLGRPFTDLDYRFGYYGPFDPEIMRQVEQMVQEGKLGEEVFRRDGYKYYRYSPTKQQVPCCFKKEEKFILEHIIEAYADLKLDDLLEDVVYQTRPMLEVKSRGDRLRMELVDGEKRIPGMELERVTEAVEELASGGGRFLEDIMPELSNQ